LGTFAANARKLFEFINEPRHRLRKFRHVDSIETRGKLLGFGLATCAKLKAAQAHVSEHPAHGGLH
jgi:hypothetical protein